jgi:hypothetical protein
VGPASITKSSVLLSPWKMSRRETKNMEHQRQRKPL